MGQDNASMNTGAVLSPVQCVSTYGANVCVLLCTHGMKSRNIASTSAPSRVHDCVQKVQIQYSKMMDLDCKIGQYKKQSVNCKFVTSTGIVK